MPEPGATVFIVDDDAAIRDGLVMLFRTHGYEPEAFPSGPAFLERCAGAMPERYAAILDLSMPEMDGLQLQSKLQDGGLDIPIIFLSGDGDIPTAVDAVRHGAIDFVEKPVDSDVLIDRVETALELQRSRDKTGWLRREFRARLKTLTARERQVLESIADGKTSRVAGAELGISERTIELHRSRILKKMGARNSNELLNRVIPNLERLGELDN